MKFLLGCLLLAIPTFSLLALCIMSLGWQLMLLICVGTAIGTTMIVKGMDFIFE